MLGDLRGHPRAPLAEMLSGAVAQLQCGQYHKVNCALMLVLEWWLTKNGITWSQVGERCNLGITELYDGYTFGGRAAASTYSTAPPTQC